MVPAVRVLAGALRPKVTLSPEMSCWHRKLRWKPTSVARWPWRTNFRCQRVDETRFSIADQSFSRQACPRTRSGGKTGSIPSKRNLRSARLRRFLHDHGDDGVEYFADGGAPVGPALVGAGRGDHHGCVGLEQQQIAVLTKPEIDSTIVEAEGVPDLFKRRDRLVAEGCRHIAEKARFLQPMVRLVGHVGSEIMHFPLPRYRKMQRIDPTCDHHHAVFSRVAIVAAGVEIFDHQEIVSRQARRDRKSTRL